MKKFSRMILDSLKVTDDDDEFEDDEYEIEEKRDRRSSQREDRRALKKAAPAMRRYDDDEYDEEEDEVTQRRKSRSQEYLGQAQRDSSFRGNNSISQRSTRTDYNSNIQRQPQPERTPAPPMRRQVSTADVCILRPKRFEECQEIIDVLKSGRVIFLTFDSTNPAIANRIMDFSFGAVYALDAQIIQLSGNNFVIAPDDAEISGEYINALTAANYGSWNNNVDANGKR